MQNIKSRRFRGFVLLVLIGGMIQGLQAQGKKGGGGGSKTDGTPLVGSFSDRLLDRIGSDGQGVYSDGDGTLEVFIHPRSGNLILWTNDSGRRVVMDFDGLDLTDVDDGGTHADFLHFTSNHRTAGVTGQCSDKNIGGIQGGDATICKMQTNVATDSDGIKYALQWDTAVTCTTAPGSPCETWVVNGDPAKLVRWGGKGKNSVGTLSDPDLVTVLSMPFKLTYTLL